MTTVCGYRVSVARATAAISLVKPGERLSHRTSLSWLSAFREAVMEEEERKRRVALRRHEYYQRTREARVEYQREHYQAHRTAVLEQQREYYQANSETILERCRRYSQEHHEAKLDYWRKYHLEHRAERAENGQRYNREHPEVNRGAVAKYQRKHPGRRAVSEAARRLIPLAKVCAMCGKEARVRHHPDYSKPLEVVCLCYRCHRVLHLTIRREAP